MREKIVYGRSSPNPLKPLKDQKILVPDANLDSAMRRDRIGLLGSRLGVKR